MKLLCLDQLIQENVSQKQYWKAWGTKASIKLYNVNIIHNLVQTEIYFFLNLQFFNQVKSVLNINYFPQFLKKMNQWLHW